MSPRKPTGGIRSLVPQSARERMYEWHPGRARRWRKYDGIQRVPAGGRVVLTFDDGPDEDATPAVLDALDAAHARATFFLLGSQLDAHLDIAHEVVRRGHEVGLHGFDHHRHDRIDPEVSRDDLSRGHVAIEQELGVRCRWFRPPYGKMSRATADACQSLGMTPVYWSAWGLDWERVDAGRIAAVACDQLDDGAILLLHDSARYARRESAMPTADAIKAIASWAQEHDISLVAIDEAIPVCEEIST